MWPKVDIFVGLRPRSTLFCHLRFRLILEFGRFGEGLDSVHICRIPAPSETNPLTQQMSFIKKHLYDTRSRECECWHTPSTQRWEGFSTAKHCQTLPRHCHIFPDDVRGGIRPPDWSSRVWQCAAGSAVAALSGNRRHRKRQIFPGRLTSVPCLPAS